MPAPSSVTASGPVVSPSMASPLAGAGTARTTPRVTGAAAGPVGAVSRPGHVG